MKTLDRFAVGALIFVWCQLSFAQSLGTKLWAFTTSAQVLSSPAIGPDGTIYFGGGGGDNKLYALSANGTQEWAFQAGSQIAAGPAIGRDGTIYAGCFDHTLYA